MYHKAWSRAPITKSLVVLSERLNDVHVRVEKFRDTSKLVETCSIEWKLGGGMEESGKVRKRKRSDAH